MRRCWPGHHFMLCITLLYVALAPSDSKESALQGIKLVVDNTFSPVIMSPATHGADVVVHSLTKFVSGASDVIAGASAGALF